LHLCLSSLENDAEFVELSVPGILATGQGVTASVTLRNIGTATWTDASGHRLGAQNPQDNGTWGLSRVNLTSAESIAPGESKTFTFSITAPGTPGIYNFQWRMLQESVEWFGDFSSYVPITVGAGSVTVCEAARGLSGTQTDASAAIQTCIDNTAAGEVLEIPAGVYRVDSQIVIQAAPIVLRTEGKDTTMPRCALVNHDCAELKASTSFSDTAGILQIAQEGSVVDHIVVNGNKSDRANTSSGQECAASNNVYGYNIRMTCNHCTLTNSLTGNALCGTGCEVSGTGSNVVLWRNTIAFNGVHDAAGMWADGVTVHDYTDSTFAANEFVDNTDVDLIFGGCERCIIQENDIVHTQAFSGGSFAALMIHAWPQTSGNFNGSDTSRNLVDCGIDRRCGFGLYLGSDAWYVTDVFGGRVHHNVVRNAEQGVAIDDVFNMVVFNNYVVNPASSTNASCGPKPTNDYTMGTRSTNVDTSLDTMGAVYTTMDWDGCIPNWWQ